MTADLICLLVLALWSIPLNHIPALARTAHSNLAWGIGNRETMPVPRGWSERTAQSRNHHDNLATIAAVILTAQVTGQTDEVTAIASIVLVALRLLHSFTYIFGIIIVRSIAYFGALAALLVIVWRLFN